MTNIEYPSLYNLRAAAATFATPKAPPASGRSRTYASRPSLRAKPHSNDSRHLYCGRQHASPSRTSSWFRFCPSGGMISAAMRLYRSMSRTFTASVCPKARAPASCLARAEWLLHLGASFHQSRLRASCTWKNHGHRSCWANDYRSCWTQKTRPPHFGQPGFGRTGDELRRIWTLCKT